MNSFLRLSLSVLLVGLAACTYAPVQEMSDARQAINAAREIGAAELAPDKLHRAEALLDQAVIQLRMGKYDTARANARAAWNMAIDARKLAEQANGSSSPP